MATEQVSLQFLEAGKCITQVSVNFSSFRTTKPSRIPTSRMAATFKFVPATWLINVTLPANLILLANDVSLNPGPGSAPPAGMKGLRIYHLNIHSLCNKLDELRLFCNEYKPYILLLNETWLDENISDDELHLTSYNIIRRDKDSFGGGVAVYIDEQLQFKHINMEVHPHIEVIWFELIPTKSKKMLFGSLYRPPTVDTSVFLQEVESIIVNYSRDKNETILLCDFNFDFALPLSGYQQKARNFLHITRVFNLMQIICECMRITEHSRTLIDLFFSTRPELYCSSVVPVGFSYHWAIFGIRKLNRLKLPRPNTVKARNYKNYDPELFREDLIISHGISLNLNQTLTMHGILLRIYL